MNLLIANDSHIPTSLVNAVFSQLGYQYKVGTNEIPSSTSIDKFYDAFYYIAYYGINERPGFLTQDDTTKFYDSNTPAIIKLASYRARITEQSTESFLNSFRSTSIPIEKLLLSPTKIFKANLSWFAGEEVASAVLDSLITLSN